MTNNIPLELRQLPQWVCAGPDKVPLSPRTGQPASVTDPNTWATFEEAARTGMKHVGFVLAEWDPYTIIDLDNKPSKPCTPEQWARHQKILEAFDSYTERSASGTGYHIIVKGRIPAGVHRDNVEVYSSARYMICTGDVVRNTPIADYQQLLDVIYGEMKPADVVELDEDTEEELRDDVLVDMAMRAENGDKFNALCSCTGDQGEGSNKILGSYTELGYESQSEADFALLSILAFYTKNNEQVRRIFRMSDLGKRAKAQKNDRYLNTSLRKIRAQQEGEARDAEEFRQVHAEYVAGLAAVMPSPQTQPSALADSPALAPESPATSPLPWPPGLVGEVAQYIYQTAIRPVPEAAIVAALGLVAGIAGRLYNTNTNTGLNLYLMLTARTGRGKEGMATGIDQVTGEVRKKVPMVDQFIGPGVFASGPAGHSALNAKPCFVSVLGEFGFILQELSDPKVKGPQLTLKKFFLDVYAKSGRDKVLRSAAYSNSAENDKPPVHSPALTLLCEGNPDSFYSGVTPQMIAEGVISRFVIIDYEGGRPKKNKNSGFPPDEGLISRLVELVTTCSSEAATTSSERRKVGTAPDAEAVLDAFDAECDDHIDRADGVEGEIWNRAHLNALRIASLLAVGCNPHAPVVTADHARWAIALVRRSIESLQSRIARGEVGGSTDSNCERQLRDRIRRYITEPKYAGEDGSYQKQGLIRHSFLSTKIGNVAAFKDHPLGARKALKEAAQHLVECGVLAEVKVPGTTARIYKINATEL